MLSARWIFGIAAYLLFVVALGAGVWTYALRDGLNRLSERGHSDLALAADRLTVQLLRYRELAVVLSRHPNLRAALTSDRETADAQKLVQSMADMTGALAITLVDTTGQVVVSSSAKPDPGDPGQLPVSRALNGALGTAHDVIPGTTSTPVRVFSFAAPVLSDPDPIRQVTGAVITRVNVEGIEQNWPGSAPAVQFSDATGRIIASNRTGLVLSNRATGQNYPDYTETRPGPHVIWDMHGARYLPDRALYLRQSLPVVGLQAEILVNTAGAEHSAFLQAAVAVALSLMFGVLIFLTVQYSRVLQHRLAAEAEINERLERRVAKRTHALSEVNTELRREVRERSDAEQALKKAQDDLVQAGKLAALGQVSAGISHELNQPLMAIGSFAENGAMLIDKHKPEVAKENLSKISELARRMGRIIKNLRAFARQESGPMTDVDLVGVVNAAVEVTAETMQRHDVTLNWVPPAAPVMVRGGEVRLTQVVVNLISNATDAMEGAPNKQISIAIDVTDSAITLTVRDTGPGIADPDRVFEPFYTTKAVGSADGMGLGLSISYGLVQSFGGAIKGGNHRDGGAVFTVGLVPAQRKAAA